ncbi:MAG: ABC transporter substrate-binding protein, partial [Oscillospiraceae bacterium]
MGMDVLMGPVTSQPTEAVAELTAKEGMPLVTATATMASITKDRDNVFRTCYTDPFQGEVLAKYVANSRNMKKVAVMYNTSSDYSDGVATAFRAKCEELGVEVVANEGYAATDKDFNTQLTKIAATKPEALIVTDYYSSSILIASQARNMGIEVPMIGPDGFDGILTVVDEANKDITNNMFFANHYFVGSDEENVKNFVTAYKAKYNEEPNSFAAGAYDAIYLIADAMERAGSTDKAAVIEAIRASDFDGVAGHITYKNSGDPVKSVYILEIKDGAYKLVDTIKGE